MPSTVFAGNLDRCRLEAEVYADDDSLIAIIYEGHQGWCVEKAQGASQELPAEFIQQVQSEMSHYVNRKGIGAPHPCSAGELALWLMRKDDGSAMGR